MNFGSWRLSDYEDASATIGADYRPWFRYQALANLTASNFRKQGGQIRCYYLEHERCYFGRQKSRDCMKVYTVSDVHVDYAENMDWILSLDSSVYQNDIMILAGDISHDLGDLARVFSSLVTKFQSVHFVPGNHELWVEDDQFDCSVEKFNAVQALSAEHGIKSGVEHYGKLSIVPMFSWYDFSFGEPDRHLSRAWRDFRACQWPSHLESSKDISNYFLELNRDQLSVKNDTVISYSHFPPRIDVMPSYIPEERRRVYPVLGSASLGEQVKDLNPDIHIYGHSHVNQSIEIGNIRYINNAYAYPTENRISRKELRCVLDLAV